MKMEVRSSGGMAEFLRRLRRNSRWLAFFAKMVPLFGPFQVGLDVDSQDLQGCDVLEFEVIYC